MARRRSTPTTFATSATDAGFALAALLADDRELAQVQGRLEPEHLARIRTLTASPQLTRPVLIAQLLAHLRPRLSELAPTLPVRLRALLAAQLPHEERRDVLLGAPLARPGFEPEPELVSRLVRIARFSNSEAERQRRREQSEGPA